MKRTARKGSILMEGVIVLPLWVIMFGGVLTLGEKGIDFIRIKGAERYAAESAITRTGAQGPTRPLKSTDAFRGRGRATTQKMTRQKDARSYILLACGGAKITSEKMVKFFSRLLDQPFYGNSKSRMRLRTWKKQAESVSSSRGGTQGTQYTNFLLARTPRSTLSRRNWDASLIVSKKIWEFKNKEDDKNDYPKTWDESLGTPSPAADPKWNAYKVKKPYKRSKTYENWSGRALQDESGETK